MTAIEEIVRVLEEPSWLFSERPTEAMQSPGLYAMHIANTAWMELELAVREKGQPLYVGKAEDSLIARDLETHFSDGETGRSTVRRSLAAILRQQLSLRPVPRGNNPLDATTYAANYGLDAESDARLSMWMRERVRLALWSHDDASQLDRLERAVIPVMKPPLNLDKWPNPDRRRIKQERAVMTAIVRSAHLD